jgi:hypothetical protein
MFVRLGGHAPWRSVPLPTELLALPDRVKGL